MQLPKAILVMIYILYKGTGGLANLALLEFTYWRNSGLFYNIIITIAEVWYSALFIHYLEPSWAHMVFFHIWDPCGTVFGICFIPQMVPIWVCMLGRVVQALSKFARHAFTNTTLWYFYQTSSILTNKGYVKKWYIWRQKTRLCNEFELVKLVSE